MDRSLLSNATSADDSPTPGYMLNEISRATTANYQVNVQLQEYLLSRITKPNHNIKFKCLVIIKHVCRTGRAEFKREIARNVAPIKECLQFRGPPDPLRGDEIYKKVRDAAKEALDAIFDSQMPVTTSAVAAANRIQGMGNDYVPEETNKTSSTEKIISTVMTSIQNTVRGDSTDIKYAGHPGALGNFTGTATGGASSFSSAGGSYGNGMSGMGNPNYSDPRLEKSWYEKAKEVAVDVASSAASKIQTFRGDSFSTSRPMSGNTSSFQNQSFNNRSGTFSSGGGAASNNGFNYATNRGSSAFDSAMPGYGMSDTKVPTVGGIVPDMPEIGPPGSGRVGGATDDGSYERGFIESLCEPSGLKPVPPEEKLKDFLTAAPTLNEDIVGNCLIDVLGSEAWQSRVKALIVVAKLSQLTEDRAHLEFWQEEDHIRHLKACTSDSKASVRTQAIKTLKVVDPSGEYALENVGSSSSKASSAKNVQKEASLLDTVDILNVGASPSSTQSFSNAVPAAAPAFSATDDALDAGLFDGLSISPTPSNNPSPPPPSMLAINSAEAPSQFVSSKSSGALKGNSPMAASTGKVDAMSHFDFLDDANAADSQSHSAPSTMTNASFNAGGNLFGDMVVSDGSVKEQSSVTYADDLASLSMPVGSMPVLPRSTGLVGGGPMMPMPAQIVAYPRGVPAHPHVPIPGVPAQHYAPPRGYVGGPPPPNQYYGGPPRGPVAGMPAQQQFRPPQPGMPMPGMQVPPQSSILAPGMLSHTAERKNIPTAEDFAGNNSGFSFIGGGVEGAAKPRNTDDSFSFITAEMNAERNRKK